MADLITAANYKTYAGISATTWDTVLGWLATGVSQTVRELCGRDPSNGFESVERTQVYDGGGNEILRLNEYPITAIASVSIIADDGSSQALDATDYRYESATGQLFRIGTRSGRFAPMIGVFDTPRWSGDVYSPMRDTWASYPGWPLGTQNISVVYTGGYATIPQNIVNACYRLMDLGFSDIGRGRFDMERIGSYLYKISAQADQDATVRSLLGLFTRGYY